MISRFKLDIVTILFIIISLNGCATSRGIVSLTPPVSGNYVPLNGKEIYIGTIIDKRIFVSNPSSPNIPSLDPDEDQSDKIKLRAIARKRNSFGKGLGDILLKEGQTVESLIRNSLRQAFIEKGYSVIENKEQVTNNTYIVNANINKFWSWMNPGFWAITLSTEISTDIGIKRLREIEKEKISVKSSDTFQTGSGRNWVEVMQRALKAYINEVKSKI